MASWFGSAVPTPLPVDLLRFTDRSRVARTGWLLALVLWLFSVTASWLLDGVIDSGLFLFFLPAVGLTTVLCGRRPAGAVIVLSLAAWAFLWLPRDENLLSWPLAIISLVVFALIGVFELALVDALYQRSRDNSEDRRRLESALRLHETMFQEMRHRIANQLNVITAMLEGSQIRIDTGSKSDDVLEQAIGRIASISYLQRIVYDKASYQRGLEPLLHDMLDHIFYDVDVALHVRATPINLSREQITIICLIVIEAAMNSLKHIYRRKRGHLFSVELWRRADGRIALTVWDDGPGFDAGSVVADTDGLEVSIMHGLAADLGGTLRFDSNGSTTVTVEFAAASLS